MLASTIAHEFNNLLMAIGPHAEIVSRLSAEESRERRAAAAIREAVKCGSGLVQQILRYGRPAEPSLTAVDVKQWLTDQAPLIESLAGAGVVVEWDLTGEKSTVMADVDQLHQVLTNLVANARDAMSGRGRIHIRTSRKPSEPVVTLSVADEGPGIAPENLQSIFEPLFTTKRVGTGLGLAVARQVVMRHGGTLTVENNAGPGATFQIVLPLSS